MFLKDVLLGASNARSSSNDRRCVFPPGPTVQMDKTTPYCRRSRFIVMTTRGKIYSSIIAHYEHKNSLRNHLIKQLADKG